eukprot:4774407-Pyramimonas_sp.AAC.2
MTVEQNVIFSGVPDAKLDDLLAQPLLQKFTPTPGNLEAHVVSCTGNQFCGFAMIETKQSAKDMAEHLERTLEIPEVRVRTP